MAQTAAKQPAPPTVDPILTVADVALTLRISRASVYNWIHNQTLPKPFQVGPNRVGWRASTIDAWLSEREAASNGEAA